MRRKIGMDSAVAAAPAHGKATRSFFHLFMCVVFPAILLFASIQVSAQVTFGGTETIASDIALGYNMAEDYYGNIFVYDAGTIYWFPQDSTGKYSSYATVATGLTNIDGLSVDSSRNLYVLQSDLSTFSHILVYQLSGGVYSLTNTLTPSFTVAYPFAVSLGGEIAMENQSTGQIRWASPSNFSSLQGNETDPYGSLGLLYAPWEASGSSVFFSLDVVNPSKYSDQIGEIQTDGVYSVLIPTGTLSAAAVGSPALDGFSNLYVADSGVTAGQGRIYQVANTNGGSNAVSTVVSSGNPAFVGADRWGNLSYVDALAGTLSLNWRYPALDFGTVSLGSTSTQTLYVTVTSDSYADAVTAISNRVVLPHTSDFSWNILDGVCSNPSPSTYFCQLPVKFSPKGPGIRRDSMEIVDSSFHVLTTVHLGGVGSAPLAVLGTSGVTVGQAGTALNGVTLGSANGIAADPSGNLYVLDKANTRIVEYTRTGPGTYNGSVLPTYAYTLSSSGLNYITVDGAGYVYTDQGESVVRIGLGTATTVATISGSIEGLAIDSYGTLHITTPESQYGAGEVVAVNLLGESYVEDSDFAFSSAANVPGYPTPNGGNGPTPFGTTLSTWGLQSNYLVGEDYPGGIWPANFVTFPYNPTHLYVDMGQDLIFGDPETSSYAAFNPNTRTAVPLPVTAPVGCVPDTLFQTEAGEYVGGSSACGTVIVYTLVTSASLGFDSAPQNTVSSDSPKSVTIYNIGNAPLSVGPVFPGGFASGTGSTCPLSYSAGPLEADSSCVLSVEFEPTLQGHYSDEVLINDNSLNNPISEQIITVTGTGLSYAGLDHFSITASNYTAYPTIPLAITVTAYDSSDRVVQDFNATVVFSSSDTSAVFSALTFTNGVATGTVTFETAGTQQVYAQSGSVNSTSPNFTVTSLPSFVVTNTNDSGTGSLRQALLNAATAGAGSVTFSSADFNTPQIINTQSTLVLPYYTTIQGPTSGSGASLTNLVTIEGNGVGQLMSVASGVSYASISNLTLNHGGYSNGGAIANAGTLSVSATTFSNNVSAFGGGIYNTGTLTVLDSTFSGNYAGHCGGGIYDDLGGTATVTNSTFEGNTGVLQGGAICLVSGSVAIHSSTITGNLAALEAGGIFNKTSALTIGDSIVSGNQLGSSGSPGNYDDIDDQTGNTVFAGNLGGNLIGYFNANSATPPTAAPTLAALQIYGGPTETMRPLPGSAAICAGLLANIPAGVTTDQRGFSNINVHYPGYSTTACVDSGAVQTNYSLTFSTEPEPISPATAIYTDADFQAAITLEESGIPFSGMTIPLTLSGTGTLVGDRRRQRTTEWRAIRSWQ